MKFELHMSSSTRRITSTNLVETLTFAFKFNCEPCVRIQSCLYCMNFCLQFTECHYFNYDLGKSSVYNGALAHPVRRFLILPIFSCKFCNVFYYAVSKYLRILCDKKAERRLCFAKVNCATE